MSFVRLYCPALVLAVWAGVLAFGVKADLITVLGLGLTGVAVVVAECERARLRRQLRRRK